MLVAMATHCDGNRIVLQLFSRVQEAHILGREILTK